MDLPRAKQRFFPVSAHPQIQVFSVLSDWKVSVFFVCLASVLCLFPFARKLHAASGPVFGLSGAGDTHIDGNGFTLSGSQFSTISLSGETETNLSTNSELFSATASAFDPATHAMYMQSIKSDGPYLAAFNTTTGLQVELSPGTSEIKLLKLFKSFVFDTKTNSLVGLAGQRTAGFGLYGFIFSGTDFIKYDIVHNTMSILASDSNTYIAMAQAFDSYSGKLYMQRVQGDGVHLVSIDVTTGNIVDITRLNNSYRFMVFDPVSKVIFGLAGMGTASFGAYGFMNSGSYFASLDPETGDETYLFAETGTFVATTVKIDPATHSVLAQRVYADGVHLVSINTKTGVLIDLGKVNSPLRIIEIDNPPPSFLTLATMSNDVYLYASSGSVPDVAGYKFVVVPAIVGSDGFYAQVYENNTQIVVAFRGTELSKDIYTAAFDIVADKSWVTGVATSTLVSKLSQAVDVIAAVKQQFGDINITLTGHSLGGALAQMIATRTKLPAVVFDAPESGKFVSQDTKIQTELSKLPMFSNSGDNQNLRLWGDPVSRVGTVVTDGIVTTLATTAVLDPSVGRWATFLDNHNLETLISQIWNGAERTEGIPDPVFEVVATIINSTDYIAKRIYAPVIEMILNVVEPNRLYGLDPGPGAEYEVVAEAGSASFAAISLPTVPGIAKYGVSVSNGNEWAEPVFVKPADILSFANGIYHFKFWGVDSNGAIAQMPQRFIFDASFAQAGFFKGSLATRQKNNIVPILMLLLN